MTSLGKSIHYSIIGVILFVFLPFFSTAQYYDNYSTSDFEVSEFYPNPAVEQSYIDISVGNPSAYIDIVFFDTLGRTAYIVSSDEKSLQPIQISTENFASSGLYFCRIIYQGRQKVRKLLIVKP